MLDKDGTGWVNMSDPCIYGGHVIGADCWGLIEAYCRPKKPWCWRDHFALQYHNNEQIPISSENLQDLVSCFWHQVACAWKKSVHLMNCCKEKIDECTQFMLATQTLSLGDQEVRYCISMSLGRRGLTFVAKMTEFYAGLLSVVPRVPQVSGCPWSSVIMFFLLFFEIGGSVIDFLAPSFWKFKEVHDIMAKLGSGLESKFPDDWTPRSSVAAKCSWGENWENTSQTLNPSSGAFFFEWLTMISMAYLSLVAHDLLGTWQSLAVWKM